MSYTLSKKPAGNKVKERHTDKRLCVSDKAEMDNWLCGHSYLAKRRSTLVVVSQITGSILHCAGAEQPQAPEHRSPVANAGLQLKIAMVMRLRLFKAGLMLS